MSYFVSWHPANQTPSLGNNEVHVWRAFLDLPGFQIRRLRDTLTSDELSRAERYHFEKDRRHFIVARGLLRAILSRYLGMEPSQLRFIYGRYGKPSLAEETGGELLRFSLSHSDGLALYAVTRDQDVGVDLERIRPELAYQAIAKRFFSPDEMAHFRVLPAEMQPGGFFSCWTRKEAYIKARGDGLSFPLNRFEVSLAPGDPPALLHTWDDPPEAARWSLQALEPWPGYAAALAVESNDWLVSYWQMAHAI